MASRTRRAACDRPARDAGPGAAHAPASPGSPARARRWRCGPSSGSAGWSGSSRSPVRSASSATAAWVPTVPWPWLVAGWVCDDHAAGANGDRGGRVLGSCCAGSGPGPTRGAGACTSGCGRRSNSAKPSAPRTWRAPPGSPTTRGRSGRRSARGSTCTRFPRSRACSASANRALGGTGGGPGGLLARWRRVANRAGRGRRRRASWARAARSFPARRVGKRAELLAGSSLGGKVPSKERWSGSPAGRVGAPRTPGPRSGPPAPPAGSPPTASRRC